MSLKIDRIQLEIIIGNDTARKRMSELEGDMRKTKNELNKLRKAGKEETEEYKEKLQILKKLQSEYDQLTDKIGLNGLSMQQLKKRANDLRAVLNQLNPNSPEYAKYDAQLKKISARMTELRTKSSGLKASFSNFADNMNKYQTAIASIGAALYGLVSIVKNVISSLMDMSDVLSEVKKTTGLTDDELSLLQQRFKTFDTRTGRKQLLEYSRIAGKLGIQGVEQISNFVKEANVAVVSLGKALGGSSEDTINTLGKIIGAFDLDTTMGWGDAVKHVGAVINELGKSSTASEKPIVEYVSRLSSVGVASNIAIPKIAAIGSTLDSLKVPAEQGSSSMMKFIYSLSDHVKEFSEVIGVSQEKYKEMLDEDVNNVMIQVLKSASAGGSGLMDMVDALDAADVSGVRMKATIGTLMNNIGELERQQAIATGEFKRGTSTLKEYDLMNNNFAGTMEKAKKEIMGFFLSFSQSLKPAILSTTEAIISMIKWVKENSSVLLFAVKTIGVAVVSLVSYHTAVKLAELWTKRKTAAMILDNVAQKASVYWNNLQRTATLLFAAAKALLTGNITRASAAMKIFNATTKLNPIGLLVTVLTTAIAAYQLYKSTVDSGTGAIADFNKQLIKEKLELNNVFDALKMTNPGTEARKELIEKANTLYGEYLPNLLTEKSSLNDIAIAQEAANKGLERNIALKAKEKAIEEATVKAIEGRAEATSEMIKVVAKNNKELTKQATDAFNEIIDATNNLENLKGTDAYSKELKRISEMKKKFSEQYVKENLGFMQDETALMSLWIGKAVGREREKNEALLEIDAMFSGYLSEQKKEEYQLSYDQLYKSRENELITEERFLELKAELDAKYKKAGTEETGSTPVITDEEKNARKKAYQERLKAEEDLKNQIEAMNFELIQDEYKKAIQEVEIWNRKEKEKIESSKASKKQKDEALVVLEQLHQQKLSQVEDNANKQTIEKLKKVDEFISSNNKKLKEDFIQTITEKYDTQINLLLAEEVLTIEIRQRINALEQLKADELSAYKKQLVDDEEKAKQAIRDKYNLGDDVSKEQTELSELKTHYDNKLLSTEEYEMAKSAIEDAYRQKKNQADASAREKDIEGLMNSIEVQKQITSSLSSMVSSLKQSELEEAGDNEEKKKQIMKKYADKEFVLRASEIVADTAQSVARTYAKYGWTPLGILLASLAGASGLVQLGVANKQRARVKQLAVGKYPVIGKDDGKLYNANYKKTVSTGIISSPTLVAEEPEMVVDNKTLYNPRTDAYGMSVLDHAKAIMGIKYNTVPQRAEGKYPETVVQNNSPSTTNVDLTMLAATVEQLAAAVSQFPKTVKATMSYYDDFKPVQDEAEDTSGQISLNSESSN